MEKYVRENPDMNPDDYIDYDIERVKDMTAIQLVWFFAKIIINVFYVFWIIFGSVIKNTSLFKSEESWLMFSGRVLIVCALFNLIDGIFFSVPQKKRCTQIVSARIYDIKIKKLQGKKVYYPVFRYVYKDKEYTVIYCDPVYDFKGNIDEQYTIYINHNMPYDICIDHEKRVKMPKNGNLYFGLVLLIGIYVIWDTLKKI